MQIIRKTSELNIEDVLLSVTVDVSSLYTVISHQIGYQAAKHFLDKTTGLRFPIKISFWNFYILRWNIITFFYRGNYYLQQTGVAMGGNFAPSLANLFTALWEN